MKKLSLWIVPVLLVLLGQSASAEEPISQFVQGLRARGYFDTALEYLDQIEQSTEVSAEVRKIVPYERAITLTNSALAEKNTELQHAQLNRAAIQLDKFIKANPGHELVGDAQSRRGKILLAKAQVSVLESRSPANSAKSDVFKQQALKFVNDARSIFTGARDTHQAAWKKFPTFIDPSKRLQIAQREKVEVQYMLAQLDLAKTTYQEAQIYKPKAGETRDPKYGEVLVKASKEFAAIHDKYRTQLIGLMAQMWQGKCFQELDTKEDIGRALGIFASLLAHPSRNATYVRMIKPQVLSFKLICLNHRSRQDYYLVEQAATEWIKQNRRELNTPWGLRIRYELARAREQLGIGTSEKTPVPPKDRPRYLRLAKDDAQYVNRFHGEFKDVTTMMISRLKRALGESTKDPDNFADAFSVANINYTKIKGSQDAWKQAVTDKKPAKVIADKFSVLKNDIKETSRLFRLTLKLAKTGDNPDNINRARYVLAYIYRLEESILKIKDRAYDSAVLAEFVGRHYREQNPNTAKDSAYLAMASYISLYNSAPVGNRRTEMRWIIGIARYIVKNWPGSERAIGAATTLGDLYNQQGKYLQAARWYALVPPTAKNYYAKALLNAGTNYWGHFTTSSALNAGPATYRRVLRDSAGEQLAVAVADGLNPAWNQWQRLKQESEIEALLNPAANGKAKTVNKKAAGKKPAKKSPGPQANPARAAEIKALQDASAKELLAAIASINPQLPPPKTEAARRAVLIAELKKKTDADLEKRLDAQIAALNDDDIGKTFQGRMNQWQSQAAWYLAKGVSVIHDELTDASNAPEDLIRAKVALAEYAIGKSQYQLAVDLLTKKPHDVESAIQVEDETKRPNDFSIKSRDFASAVYQTLAQGYIGLQKLEDFQKVMTKLKAVIGEGNATQITLIYKRLGRAVKRKIEALKRAGDDAQLAIERKNFESVADSLLNDANLDANTAVWIGETAFGLGSGLGDPAEARNLFELAAKAYGVALKDANMKENQQLAIKLRLLNCRRQQQEFTKALDLSKEVLKKRPRLLPAQIEAALTLLEWGRNKDPDKFLDAIGSKEMEKENIWGWREIGKQLKQEVGRLDQELEALNQPGMQKQKGRLQLERDAAARRYLHAMYTAMLCRYLHGVAQSDVAAQKLSLSNAKREILAFAMTAGNVRDNLEFDVLIEDLQDGKTVLKQRTVKVRATFDKLYKSLHFKMGVAEADIAPATVKWGFDPPEPPIKVDPRKEVDEKKQEDESSGALGMIFGVVFLLAGLGGGGWFLMKTMGKPKGKRRPSYAYGGATFGGSSSSTASSGGASTGRPKQAAARSGGQKPAARRKPASGGQKPKSGGSTSGKPQPQQRPPRKKPE